MLMDMIKCLQAVVAELQLDQAGSQILGKLCSTPISHLLGWWHIGTCVKTLS